MRLLHIVHHFPPELRGGTQTYVSQLAREQIALGHEVRVVAGALPGVVDPETPASSVDLGVPVTRIGRRDDEIVSGEVGSERIEALVAAAARDHAAELVHVHHWSTLSRGLVSALTELGVPLVVTLHDLYTTCPRFHRMPDARSFCSTDVTTADCAACVARDVPGVPLPELDYVLNQRLESYREELAQASKLLCVSNAQRVLLDSLATFEADAVDVVPLGLPRSFEPSVERDGPVEGKLRIRNWAGFDPRKGTHVLLEALRLCDEPGAYELHLHGREGEDGYMNELHRLAEGLDVHFHGPFQDEELLAFGRGADVAVFPFLAFETYGFVVDEALRLGLPTLVSDHGAPPERLFGKGFAVGGGDPRGLASALEWLLDQPDELERMAQVPTRVGTLEEHVDRLDRLYAELR